MPLIVKFVVNLTSCQKTSVNV